MWFIAAAMAVLAAACRPVPDIDIAAPKRDSLAERMISANRIMAQTEELQIDTYLERLHWNATRLGGGARVMVTTSGSGHQVQPDDTVAIAYSVEDLAGRVIYSHIDDTVVAGRLKPTRGLDAALLTLRQGAKATVLMPSEQAYGVVGDGQSIGQRVVLVCKVEVGPILNRQ